MDTLNPKAWLLVKILETLDENQIVEGELCDGSVFRIKVNKWLVSPLKDKPDHGWIEVDFVGEDNKRASVSLPAPILDKGHKVTVPSEKIKKYRR